MKLLVGIVSLLLILAAIGFVIYGYSGYFKIEQSELQTSDSALQAAKQVKARLEAQDMQTYQSMQLK